jgi:cellulose synthase (UDP-forming)
VRWGRGVVNLLHQMKMLDDPNLSLAQKLNYFISIAYWFAPVKRLVFICIPILSALFAIPVVNCTLEQILFFWLPMTVLTAYSFRKISGKIRSSGWSNLYETIMFPFLLFPILFELFGFSLKKFKVTRKDGKDESALPFRYFLPYLILIVLSIAAVFRGFQDLFVFGMSGAGVTLFWLIYNLLLMVMAVLFLFGSIAHEHEGLHDIELTGAIYQAGLWQIVKVNGISDTMVSFFSQFPYYIDPRHPCRLVLQDLTVQKEGWQPVDVEIINKRVISVEGGYVYECDIESFGDYDDFLHLVHDRPVESVLMGTRSSLTISLWNILLARFLRTWKNRYAEPEIVINKSLPLHNTDKSIYIRSFFWSNLTVRGFNPPKKISFKLNPESDFVAEAIRQKRVSLFTWSYSVTDMEKLISHPLWYEQLLFKYKK